VPELLERLQQALADRYAVDRELGRGGMATVYLAEDLKHHRKVAIKVLDPDLARALGAERFLREVEITAKLNHPHILPLLDSGRIGDQAARQPDVASAQSTAEFLFYVMPYVEGETLRERMDREGQLPLEDALSITREVAAALGYAHSQGVIHRDIKPENVLLSAGEAVVADFGIARAISEAGGGRLTETGMSIGTPTYMSPEQAAGETDLDPRSDVYSLGCVLYEMLAGEPPYTGPTAQAIVAKKLSDAVPRVSVVRELVPRTVETALERALAKAPADRFPTAQSFAEALRTGTVMPRAWLRGWRRVAALLATFAVLALAVRGVHAILTGARIHKLAVLPLTDLTNDQAQGYLADGVQEALTAELGQLGLSVTARATMAQFRDARKPIREIAREVGADAVIEGSVYRSGDSLQIATRLYDKKEREIWTASYAGVLSDVVTLYRDFARAIAHEIGVRLSPTNEARLRETRAVNPRVYEAYLRGMHVLDRSRTDADIDSAIAYFQQAVDQNPADPLAYAGLALGYVTIGHGGNPPDDVWPKARAAAERALRLDSTLAEAWAALAEFRTYSESDWEGAERAFRRANELNPSLAMNHYHYAWYLALFGRVDEAFVEHRRAQELDPLTPLHTVWMPALYLYSETLDTQRVLTEARRNAERYPNNATAWGVLSALAQAAGLLDEWRAATQRKLALEPENELGRALFYAQTGRREDALRIVEKYEALPPNGSRALGLANAYATLGDEDRALRWYEYEPHHAHLAWIVGWGVPDQEGRDDPRVQAIMRRLNLQWVPGQRAPRPLPVKARPLAGT
jgi:TolB-like protein